MARARLPSGYDNTTNINRPEPDFKAGLKTR